MKSIFKLYVNTSKGNDNFLYKELQKFHINPKYDDHLKAFYFKASFSKLFQLSFQSFLTENMYIQIGQRFNATEEQHISKYLEKIQFKNYLLLNKRIVQNIALKILIRETSYTPSQNVLTSLLQSALEKQVIKKQYYQNILQIQNQNQQRPKLRENVQSFFEIKQIVERKWEETQNLVNIQKLEMITNNSDPVKQISSNDVVEHKRQTKGEKQEYLLQKNINQSLQIPQKINLTFYIRKNYGRILLKINKQEMYKHGWKKYIGWGPIRQSIAASILNQCQLLKQNEQVRIWDPFCGSGTFGLVAASMYYKLPVRQNYYENFNWPDWPIYKQQYLDIFFEEKQKKNKQIMNKLKFIGSDINFKVINYAIKNVQSLLNDHSFMKQKQQGIQKLIKYRHPIDQIFEIKQNQLVFICEDFQKAALNIFGKQSNLKDVQEIKKINIVTNLPYTHSRSQEHIPLNQLQSIYRRFSKMIQKYKNQIKNVFILINNAKEEIKSRNHFLNISEQKWNLLANFDNGGISVGLYSWTENKSLLQYTDYQLIYQQLKKQNNRIQKIDPNARNLDVQLTKYRQKISKIDRKNYYLPSHLLRVKVGWRRVLEKRRRRHLLRAYEIFSRRRDKMIALSEYAKNKRQIKMLKRGSIWRKRNSALLPNDIQNYQKQIKKEFESRIEQALIKFQEQQKKNQKSKQVEHQKKQMNQFHRRKLQRIELKKKKQAKKGPKYRT